MKSKTSKYATGIPILSKVSHHETSCLMLGLARTKSGLLAINFSIEREFIFPRFTHSSSSSISKSFQASSGLAITFPPPRVQTSAKLPISTAVLSAFSTVTVRPKSSVKTMPPFFSSFLEQEEKRRSTQNNAINILLDINTSKSAYPD